MVKTEALSPLLYIFFHYDLTDAFSNSEWAVFEVVNKTMLGLLLLWAQWVWVRTLKTLWFQWVCVSTPMMLWCQCMCTSMMLWSQCMYVSTPRCLHLNACVLAHPWHSDLNVWVSTPMMLWSQCVCVSTSMMLGSQCVCVWAHPWHSDLNVTLKRELQMMLTDNSWSFSPTK